MFDGRFWGNRYPVFFASVNAWKHRRVSDARQKPIQNLCERMTKVLLHALALFRSPFKDRGLLVLGVIEEGLRLIFVLVDADGKCLAFEDPLIAMKAPVTRASIRTH